MNKCTGYFAIVEKFSSSSVMVSLLLKLVRGFSGDELASRCRVGAVYKGGPDSLARLPGPPTLAAPQISLDSVA